MKRNERHHLKDNELAHFATAARATVEARRSQATGIIVGIVVILAIAVGYTAWRGRVQGRAGTLLAEAMAVQDTRVGAPEAPGSPSAGPSFPTEKEKNQAALTKLKIVADQYPATEAGLFARFREAGVQMALGNAKEASAAYQQVIDRAGDSIYGQMARLGLAEAQVRSGEFDKAIETYKLLAQRKDGPLPVDGILVQLGRTYIEAGKPSDAQQTFTRVVQEFPESTFIADARRELDALKKS
jgi:predicted negative regulator of RcsB-dependent stress response